MADLTRNPAEPNLAGKVVLLCGANELLLSAAAGHFRSHGARVCLNGVALPPDSEAIPAFGTPELTEEAFAATVQQLVSAHGRIDVAAYAHPFPNGEAGFFDIELATWQAGVTDELARVFAFGKVISKRMANQKAGRMLFVTSGLGVMGRAQMVDTCALSAGVIGFNKSLSREMLKYGVTSNCVAYALLDEMMKQGSVAKRLELSMMLKFLGATAMPTAGDVAAYLGFLGSGAADHLTGQTLHLNGGLII